MLLQALRIGLVLGALAAVLACALRRRQVLAGLRTFLLEPQPPLNLALLRILVFGSILFETTLNSPSWFATLPAYFRSPPPGWGFLGQSLPMPAAWVGPAEWLLRGCAALATLGLFTRVTSLLTTILTLIVFLIPNLFFKISHDLHVLVQQAAVVSASRAGDGLSIDAWLRRRRGQPAPGPDPAYTLPVRLSWLLMGTMYLFPGLWKLWKSGDLWVNGSKLAREIMHKWGDTPDYVPTLRVDQLPLLLAVLGSMTLLLEIGFFFTLFSRTARVYSSLSLAGFHLGIGLTMGIWFSPIHPLLVLFDFPPLLTHPAMRPLRWVVSKLRPASLGAVPSPPDPVPPSTAQRGRLLPVALVGGLCLAGMFVTGTLGIVSWPWSVYPRFAERHEKDGGSRPALEFVAVGRDGSKRVLHPTFAPIEDSAAVAAIERPLFRRSDSSLFRHHLKLVKRLVAETAGPFRPGDKLEIYSYTLILDPNLRSTERKLDRRLVAQSAL